MLMPASCSDDFYLRSKSDRSRCYCCRVHVWGQCGFKTHRARSRVGDLPSVGHPLVIGTLLVGEGSVEDHADVGHGVDTNC